MPSCSASPRCSQHRHRRSTTPGASHIEIKIGHIVPYSDPVSTHGTIGKAAAAYFAKVNAEGGINGRKIGWKPTQYLSSVSVSVSAVIKPAGPENTVGVISATYMRDPADNQWAGVKE